MTREDSSRSGRSQPSRRDVLALAALGLVAGAPGTVRAAGREEQLTWGIHVSLAPGSTSNVAGSPVTRTKKKIVPDSRNSDSRQ